MMPSAALSHYVYNSVSQVTSGPRRGRTTPSLAPVRPLWGRLESVYQLSAGSIPFGHSTRGYSHSPPLGTGSLKDQAAFPTFGEN